MKYFFKRFWLLILFTLLINVPLLVFCTVRTDKTVTLKGDTTIVDNFVEIENPYKQQGSFSTIYVISLDHSTIFQNWMLGFDATSEVADISSSYLHFSDAELTKMGQIQHQSSIQFSLIHSYNEAHKVRSEVNIDYKFEYFQISYYSSNSVLKIGDKIIAVDGVYGSLDFDQMYYNMKNATDNTKFLIKRDQVELEFTKKQIDVFGSYAYYNINQDTIFPKYTIKQTNVGGPSGGLLQTLSLYNSLIEEDITKGYKISGTGTISSNGTVGAIGGIKQKIYTAYDDSIDIFFCPVDNYDEALIAYNELPNKDKMKLFKVATFSEALEVLKNV